MEDEMNSTQTTSTATEELYWEARGSGSPILLIGGTPGDCGQFDLVADALAQKHLTITYDRRATSRSRQSAPLEETSPAAQADDAAEVLAAVGVSEATVYGTSNGAAVALELALRHPHLLAGVLLHEPPLLTVVSDPEPVAAAMGSVIGPAMERGGPAAALEAFLRFAFGDAVVDDWSQEFRERMLSNAEMVFSVEMPAFQSYRPQTDALADCAVRASVLVGEEQELPFFREAAGWVALNLGTEVRSIPGAHGPQFTHPDSLAAAIGEFAESS
jgi:pimeloyl-ACP methyl ester carboxylesterase